MMITIRAGSVELIVNGGRTLSSLLYALQNLAGFFLMFMPEQQ
jgi:hypothetical protein